MVEFSHETDLPWAKSCKLILLVQPDLQQHQKEYFLLTNTFSSQQESSLEDYIQLSASLQFNYR